MTTPIPIDCEPHDPITRPTGAGPKMVIPRDWTFKDKSVADAFDQHVREQLPWYDLTTGVITHFARHYLPENGKVYDIGASNGNVGRALAPLLASRNATLTAIDSSQEMCAKYDAPGEIVCANAAKFEYRPYDLAVCFLVLMFLTPAERKFVIERLRVNLNYGGAILIFDRCQPVTGYPATVIHRLTLAGKLAAHVPADEIMAKEMSLAGAQRPLSSKEIPKAAIEIFRFGDFAGWLIEGLYPDAG